MANHPHRSRKAITLEIATGDDQGRVQFASVGGSYHDRAKAMTAAKKFAGRGSVYTGDGLSIRYSGPNGTVYLCADRPNT